MADIKYMAILLIWRFPVWNNDNLTLPTNLNQEWWIHRISQFATNIVISSTNSTSTIRDAYEKASNKSDSWHPALIGRMDLTKPLSCTCWRWSTDSSPIPYDVMSPSITFLSPGGGSRQIRHLLSLSHAGFSNVFGNLPGSSAVRSEGFPRSIQEQQLQLYGKPQWSNRPMAFDDGSPFCQAYMSYVDAAEAMIRAATPLTEIVGTEQPNVNRFFQPCYNVKNSNVGHCASSLMAALSELELASRLAWILSMCAF